MKRCLCMTGGDLSNVIQPFSRTYHTTIDNLVNMKGEAYTGVTWRWDLVMFGQLVVNETFSESL